MRKVVKPKTKVVASTQSVDNPQVVSELVNQLEDYLENTFEDNLIMQFASYVDDDYSGEDVGDALKKYNAAKMQYLMCAAKLVRRGDWVE